MPRFTAATGYGMMDPALVRMTEEIDAPSGRPKEITLTCWRRLKSAGFRRFAALLKAADTCRPNAALTQEQKYRHFL